MINIANFYISRRTLFFLTIILILLAMHLFYGCCSVTITKNAESNNPAFNTKNELTDLELTDLSNKYTTENHFYIPNKSLSAEEIKNIAHRGGNNT
jgi:predicted membrane protein